MLSSTFNRTNAVFLSLLAMASLFLLTAPAFAAATTQPGTGLENVICNALGIIQGGVGKGIAAFAIIFIGISLFLGKVSWGVAISTALGIAAIFGAASIVQALGGGTDGCTEGFKDINDVS